MSVEMVEDIYVLSPTQQGMLFHSVAAPEAGAYFEQLSYALGGDLDLAAFRRAWQRVLDRHPVLRTAFVWEDVDEPVQVVQPRVELPLVEEDWRGLAPADQAARLDAFLRADRARGFDLADAPLLRLAVLQLADDVHQFVLSNHHLLLDGWSLSLVLREVFAYYDADRRGRAVDLPLPRPYRDYIAWLEEQDLAPAEAFWRQTLRGFHAPTPLPGTGERPADDEDVHAARETRLSAATTAALQGLARQHQLTLNTLVQGAWAVLLSRYSGETDVVFGTAVAGRPADLPGVESMVGLFINALPVRARVEADAPLLPWLQGLQAHQADLRHYEYSPLVRVQSWSEVPRGLPLFESVLVFENYPLDAALREQGGRLDVRNVRTSEPTNYPLTVTAVPGSELALKVTYDRRRFDAGSIERLLGHFGAALESIAADPDQPLGAVSLLTPAERGLVDAWNDTAADYPRDQTLAALFEAQVARTPEAVALRYEGQTWTYRDLNARANRLAHYLQRAGVGPEVVVALCAERSPDTVVGLLGILKAGGAYLPLDPTYPRERLVAMLADNDVPVLLTQARLVADLPPHAARVVCLDDDWARIEQESGENPTSAAGADSLAYVIYTSGSTGRPKGVAVEQRQLLNRFAWMWRAYPFAADEGCCQKTTVNFVDSVWELLGPLLQGVPTAIIPDAAVKDPFRLVQTLAAEGVTRLWVVPSLLRALLDAYPDLGARLPRLGFWVTSGEPLTGELYGRFRAAVPHARLLNLYGTSEVFDATVYEARAGDEALATMPIGRPIANTRAYVLDDTLQPAPLGVPGELYVGGVGLARGYVKRPDLTAERFVPGPFGGPRLYRTGDRVRLRSDGELEFLGRTDFQVKLRGFRIELGEVEGALAAHPAVRQAVAVVREDAPGDRRLVAYFLADAPAPTATDLRAFLQATLPEYMVPSAFVPIDALPLTPNGKVDRAALPRPTADRADLTAAFVAPRTPSEERVAAIWREVLGVERVGVHDNFFDLGGHSLLAMQLLSRLREAFAVELPLRALLDERTVAGVAAAIDATLVGQATEENLDALLEQLEGLSEEEAAALLAEAGGDEV